MLYCYSHANKAHCCCCCYEFHPCHISFNLQRRSSLGISLPLCLQNPSAAICSNKEKCPPRRRGRIDGCQPLLCLSDMKDWDGREYTVSFQDLAPCPRAPFRNESQERKGRLVKPQYQRFLLTYSKLQRFRLL